MAFFRKCRFHHGFAGRRVVVQGTPEERKSFVRAFVPEIRLHPREARDVVRIWRLPPPANGTSGGGSSLLCRTGVREEVEKNRFSDAEAVEELLCVVFGTHRAALVPG